MFYRAIVEGDNNYLRAHLYAIWCRNNCAYAVLDNRDAGTTEVHVTCVQNDLDTLVGEAEGRGYPVKLY